MPVIPSFWGPIAPGGGDAELARPIWIAVDVGAAVHTLATARAGIVNVANQYELPDWTEVEEGHEVVANAGVGFSLPANGLWVCSLYSGTLPAGASLTLLEDLSGMPLVVLHGSAAAGTKAATGIVWQTGDAGEDIYLSVVNPGSDSFGFGLYFQQITTE